MLEGTGSCGGWEPERTRDKERALSRAAPSSAAPPFRSGSEHAEGLCHQICDDIGGFLACSELCNYPVCPHTRKQRPLFAGSITNARNKPDLRLEPHRTWRRRFSHSYTRRGFLLLSSPKVKQRRQYPSWGPINIRGSLASASLSSKQMERN